jgi:hypothetical protein
MKVRRKVVLEKYAGMIERLYRDDGRRTTDDRR